MTDCLVQQHGSYRRVHAAAQTEYHFVVTDLRPQFLNGRVNERRRCPVTFASADSEGEVRQHLGAFRRVEHLRMELDGICLLSLEMESGIDHVIRGGDNLCIVRNGGDGVAVGHPNLRMH